MRGLAAWLVAVALPAVALAQDGGANRLPIQLQSDDSQPEPGNGAVGQPADPAPILVPSTGTGSTPLMSIDQERLFLESEWGQRVQNELAERSRDFAEENERLAQEFSDEEQELTRLRDTLSPEEFRARADEFDQRVVEVRRERDSMGQELQALFEQERTAFLQASLPLLAQLMEERGAVAVLDQRVIFVSAEAIDVTQALIERINAAEGAGEPIQPPADEDAGAGGAGDAPADQPEP